jgi:hypothetical protein
MGKFSLGNGEMAPGHGFTGRNDSSEGMLPEDKGAGVAQRSHPALYWGTGWEAAGTQMD